MPSAIWKVRAGVDDVEPLEAQILQGDAHAAGHARGRRHLEADTALAAGDEEVQLSAGVGRAEEPDHLLQNETLPRRPYLGMALEMPSCGKSRLRKVRTNSCRQSKLRRSLLAG